MKKIGLIFILFMATNCLSVVSIFAQFSYDKINDDTAFEFEKPIEFYWNPRYNRVEGLFLNVGAKVRPRSVSGLQFYADVGGGFWNQAHKQIRFTAGLRKDLFDINRLSIGAEVYRNVESADDWKVNNFENTVAALLFREDYKDYYGTHGVKLYIDHKFKGIHTLRFEIGRRTFDALKRNINWSVFAGDFDDNPTRIDSFIAEGDEIGLRFITAFDWRDNPIFPLSGWYIETIYERTFEDFNTDGLFLSVKRYQQTFGNQRLFLRGTVGMRRGNITVTNLSNSSIDSLAEQYSTNLGGIGSLRGFDDEEFSGNRMFMLNANYLFGGDLLQKVPLQNIPLFGAFWSMLSFGVFMDTGWAWTTDEVTDGLFNGFSQLTLDNLKTNIGISIYLLEGVFRLDIAKRLDRSNDDFRISFRLLEKF